MMRNDKFGALPVMAVLVIIGLVLLMVGWIVIAVTFELVLTLLLVGAGLYLLVKPDRLAGMGTTAKLAVPFVLMVLGLVVFSGWLRF